MSGPETIAITSATGSQGRAIITALLSLTPATPLHILALTRTPTSDAAQSLLSLPRPPTITLTLVTADFASPSTLTSAFSTATSVFINTIPTQPDLSVEVAQARSVLAAARASATVRHVVYSSVAGIAQHELWARFGGPPAWCSAAAVALLQTELLVPSFQAPRSPLLSDVPTDHATRKTMQGYYGAKTVIESLTRRWWLEDGEEEGAAKGEGRSWGILRPAFFVANLLPPRVDAFWHPELRGERVLRSAMPEGTRLMLVDDVDVGAVGAMAVYRGAPGWERTMGKVVDIGGQALGLQEIADVMSKAAGSEVKVERVSEEEARKVVMEDQGLLRFKRDTQAWALQVQDSFHVQDLEQALGRKMTTFEEALSKQEVREALKEMFA